MLGSLMLALVGLGLAIFMVNLLYVGIGKRQINGKGITYSRSTTPVMYWVVMTLAAYGQCWGLFIDTAGIMLLLQ